MASCSLAVICYVERLLHSSWGFLTCVGSYEPSSARAVVFEPPYTMMNGSRSTTRKDNNTSEHWKDYFNAKELEMLTVWDSLQASSPGPNVTSRPLLRDEPSSDVETPGLHIRGESIVTDKPKSYRSLAADLSKSDEHSRTCDADADDMRSGLPTLRELSPIPDIKHFKEHQASISSMSQALFMPVAVTPTGLSLPTLSTCESCRNIKKKCDGAKPSCGRCLRTKWVCKYRPRKGCRVRVRRDSSTRSLVTRSETPSKCSRSRAAGSFDGGKAVAEAASMLHE